MDRLRGAFENRTQNLFVFGGSAGLFAPFERCVRRVPKDDEPPVVQCTMMRRAEQNEVRRIMRAMVAVIDVVNLEMSRGAAARKTTSTMIARKHQAACCWRNILPCLRAASGQARAPCSRASRHSQNRARSRSPRPRRSKTLPSRPPLHETKRCVSDCGQ